MAIKKINSTLCNSCGVCVRICPTDVFRLDNSTVYIKYPQDCMVCNLCTMNCPQNAIIIDSERAIPIPNAY